MDKKNSFDYITFHIKEINYDNSARKGPYQEISRSFREDRNCQKIVLFGWPTNRNECIKNYPKSTYAIFKSNISTKKLTLWMATIENGEKSIGHPFF